MGKRVSFFRPPTLHSLEIGAWCCVSCAVGVPTPYCCSSGLNDFHLLFQRMTESYVQSAVQVPECSNSALNFNWQREAHGSHADFPLIINSICYYCFLKKRNDDCDLLQTITREGKWSWVDNLRLDDRYIVSTLSV